MTTAAPDVRDVLIRAPRRLLVGGEWREATDGAVMAVDDPATGETIAEVADARQGDGMAALDAAIAAQPRWALTEPIVRSELLRRTYEALIERREELATVITLEMGKPLAEARSEVDYAADFFRWFSGEAVRIEGDYRSSPKGAGRIVVLRQPVGPCLLVTPWNFPLAMGARKLAPALAAGCTVVLKPAPQTPLSSLILAEMIVDAGAPPGVVNVVPTSDASGLVTPLMKDGRLRKLSFTGSTAVGRRLIEQSGAQVLRCSMELGGNAPFLVFGDADLEEAVAGAMDAKMRNGGQACVAANRFLVAENLAPAFASELAARMGALRLGHGLEPESEVGPLIDEPAVEKVHALVADATSRGASVLAGGRRPTGRGHFFEPTVIADVPADAHVLHQEIFGPVAPVVSFSSEDEALALANSTEHGLVAYLYCRDVERSLRVAEGLEFGMVGLNQGMVSNAAAPFGGVKQSGLGREGGREGIAEYLETKYVTLKM